jgi:hypothetical protein
MNGFSVRLLNCIAMYACAQPFEVEFDPGCEAMIYTTDGTPLQGMSSLPFVKRDTSLNTHM